ncbi:MAG: PEP-utilizing enzyme [Candidatus Parcubacteria bacterium]|nr:PEP-utilizing enzyme [Candidatus Parcubacteria bacterium]
MSNIFDFKLLKELVKKEWYAEHADAKPFFAMPFSLGFVYNLYPDSYDTIITYFQGQEMDWMTLVEDQYRLYHQVVAKELAKPGHWQEKIAKWQNKEQEFIKLYNDLILKDLTKLTDNELFEDVKTYSQMVDKSRQSSAIIDAFMFAAEPELKQMIIDFGQNKGIDVNEAFDILTRQADPSFFNLVDDDIIKVIQELNKENLEFNEKNIIANKTLLEFVNEHLRKYFWFKTPSFSESGKDYQLADFVNEGQRIVAEGLDKIIERNKIYLANRKITADYIKKHGFTAEILAVANLSVMFIKWMDLRKENTLRCSHLNSRYLQEISRRQNIPVKLLAYLCWPELPDLFSGKIKQVDLENRASGCLLIFKGDKFYFSTAKEDIDLVKNNIIRHKPRAQENSEIKGTVACQGVAKGKVTIIRSLEALNKMREGDILVSPMTRPEHIAAIRKAAAIVTDDGGITCHAAIVARELNIPCIIGTRIATHVLKDGDIVEVDANQGIVKIIK